MSVPEKLVRMVENIFMQGDSRYIDPEGSVILAEFLYHKAIVFEKIYIGNIKTTDEEKKGIWGPQKNYKALAKRLLNEKEYRIIGYERLFPGGRTDVLAKDKEGNNIVVECCSCRISKAIQYLEEENTILWVLSHSDEDKMPVTRLPMFIFKRGPKWERAIKLYLDFKMELLRKTPSLLESLYKDEN